MFKEVDKMVNVDPYLHAVLLLKGADKEINEENLTAVVKAAGIEPDTARVKVLVEAVKDVNWDEALKMPTVAAAPVAASAGGQEAPKEEKKEEEKKEEKSEEEAAAGLAGLFG